MSEEIPTKPADEAGHRIDIAAPLSERVFRTLVNGRVFLIGVLIGLLICTVGGWIESHRSPFQGFVRFHRWINSETLFYPTISQMVETGRQDVNQNKILVIVAGDSILFGSGQLPADLWTRRLQEQLGPDYTVKLLAYPGSAFADAGVVAGEVLQQQRGKVILLSHMFIAHLNPLEKQTHPHFFWQARARGLLMNDPAREAAAQHAIAVLAEQNKLREMPLASKVDAYLRFNDLWNAVGYRNFMTVWEPLTAEHFWWPRKDFTDPEVPKPVEARNPPDLYAQHMALPRRWIEGLCIKGQDGQWKEDPNSKEWKAFESLADVVIPPAMRKCTLAVVTYESIFYRRDLTPDEKIQYELSIQGTVRRMNERGYSAVPVGKDFSVDDYNDVLHFSPTGGVKMADTVAPQIKAMAKQLGYTN